MKTKKITSTQNKAKAFIPDMSSLFSVAGIGASAGGLDAFKSLIKAIPNNSGIAWILVQHQHPSHESKLPHLLQKVTTIPVIEISNDVTIEPNVIYVMPANKMLTIKAGKLKLSPRPTKDKIQGHYPINLFFESLALAYEANAVGVVLSGTATDGTKGLKAIKDHGGITFAQSIKSSEYPGMPESAIAAHIVDFVLPPGRIPKKLLEIKKIISSNVTAEGKRKDEENHFKEILSLLHIHKDVDFTYYKQTTIRRRILRRMVLNKYKKIADYVSHLRQNKDEILALHQDMLIPVTSFFRDEKVFENLCETVFPTLIKNKSADNLIRIWVAGCSTGEEAYSMAICFKEYLGLKKEKVQIFATDLSEPAIAKARIGIYNRVEAEVVSHHRLTKYFTFINGNYQVKQELRDMCVFAVHNFLKDPPFSKIHFISCRNVLIYMDTYLQKKALSTFHYSLNSKGLLMLGKSENTIGISDLFIPENKVDKIFIRKDVPSVVIPVTPRYVEPQQAEVKKRIALPALLSDFQKNADDLLLAKFTPPTVVVNEQMEIVYFRGKTSFFLQQSAGKPTHNLLKLAKLGLTFELRNILHKCRKEKKAVKKENIPIQAGKKTHYVTIQAIPLSNIIEPHWVIIFEEQSEVRGKPLISKRGENSKRDKDVLLLHQLEEELAQLREDMRSISEEQEASNEELQSSNEELLSSNEEMQSLNEELETSKEELQSTVEELTVVNQEMINLNEQLATEKEYAEAIIATIPQPMLVLDKNLRVTVANQQFYEKFLVSEGHTEGKLIYDIGNGEWNITELRILLEAILPEKESFYGFEVEHTFQNIGHRIMRLNAKEIIREKSEKLLLLAIEDITDIKKAARKIEESEAFNRSILDASPDCIKILDEEGKMQFINSNGICLMEMDDFDKYRNRCWWDIWEPHNQQLIKDALAKAVAGEKIQFQAYSPTVKGNYKWWDVIVMPLQVEGIALKEQRILSVSRDITDFKLAARKIEESEEKFKAAVAAVEGIVWTNNAQGEMDGEQIPWSKLTGQTYDEYKGYGWAKVVHPDDAQPTIDAWNKAVKKKSVFIFEHRLKVKDNTWRQFSIRAIPLKNSDGSIREWVGVHTDITEKRNAEIKIKESAEQFTTLADNMENLAWMADGEGTIYWYNKRWYEYTNTTLEEMYGWGWQKVHHPDHIDRVIEFVKKAWLVNEPFELTFPLKGADGKYKWFLTRAYPISNSEGKVIRWIGTNTNIDEQKKAEEQFRLLADQAPMWVWLTDNELNVLYANTELLRFVGIRDYKDFTGRVWEQKVHPDDIQLVHKAFAEAVSLKEFFTIECRVQNYSTEVYEWFYVKCVPRYEANEFSGFIGTAININEQKLTLSQLEYRKALLEAHNESSLDGILLVDTKGKILSFNHRFIEIWNMPQHILDDKDDEAALSFALTQLVNPHQFIEKVEWLYKHPDEISIDELQFNDGKIIERHGYPVKAPDGSYYAWSWSFRDITNQKLAERKIKESEENFRQLSEIMPTKVSNADAAGNVFYYNQSWLDYTGKNLEEMIATGWEEVMHPEEVEIIQKNWKHSIKTGQEFEMEMRMLNKDGEYYWHLSRSTPLRDEQGQIMKWVGTNTEIQKIKEEEQRKSDFIKMVSHELKTPVTSIKGYVQLLLQMLQEQGQVELAGMPLKNSLSRIDKQVVRLTRLITEMLDLSRLESGKLDLKPELFSINDLVTEAVQDIRHTNSVHTIDIQHNFYGKVLGDKDRIQQVVINFITNSIKYSPDNGNIEVKINGQNETHVAVSVKDYGIGIRKEEHQKIFERFYRAEGNSENSFSGFGIGLFIANEIVQRHKGVIKVDSEEGKGSVFTFILPVAAE